jgi:DNA-binding transcriptional LysR family regulator
MIMLKNVDATLVNAPVAGASVCVHAVSTNAAAVAVDDGAGEGLCDAPGLGDALAVDDGFAVADALALDDGVGVVPAPVATPPPDGVLGEGLLPPPPPPHAVIIESASNPHNVRRFNVIESPNAPASQAN